MINLESDRLMSVSDNGRYAEAFIEEGDVDFTATLPGETVCQNCSQPVTEYVEGWLHDDNVSPFCCGVDADDFDDDEEREDADRAEPAPSAPGNWVGFTVLPDKGSVEVQISVGDPRGCLTMQVRRWVDPDTGNEELLLHVPYAGQPQSHMELIEKSAGTFVLR